MKALAVLSAVILISIFLSIFSLPIFGYCHTYQCLVAAVKNFSAPESGSPIALASFYLDAVLYSGSAVFSSDRFFLSALLLIFLGLFSPFLIASARISGKLTAFLEENGALRNGVLFSWLALHETSPTLG